MHIICLSQVFTGALLGGYESVRIKNKKSPTCSRLESLDLILPGAASDQDEMIRKAHATASGALMTRCVALQHYELAEGG